MPLKPQDLLAALRLAVPPFDTGEWTYAELADSLGLSDSEANAATRRAAEAGLVTRERGRASKPRPVRRALLEFVDHGARYAFPAQPGETARGMPTAHSAPPLDAIVAAGAEATLVWPDAVGRARGQAVEPLYPTVPGAARRDAALYEVLALLDAIRVGRARERRLAGEELGARIAGG